jgi:hypothetical protein
MAEAGVAKFREAGAFAAAGLDRLLAAYAARIAAIALGIDGAGQRVVLAGGRERARLALRAGGIQALRRILRPAQQRQRFLRVGLGGARVLACVGGQQHALS